MIYWSSTITDKFPETQSKADNGYNHRIYYTKTEDFKTYSKTKLLYNPGFNVIDASIKQDGDQFIMFLKDETREPAEKNLKVAFSTNLYGPYTKASNAITGDYWAEGPTVLKINEKFIVYFDKYIDHNYGAVTSEDLKNWDDISDRIDFPKGARHGTVFKISYLEFNNLKQQLKN